MSFLARATREDLIALTTELTLPKAKGNRTLLGTDFLGKAGIVLNLKHKNWHFYGDQTRKIPFREDIPVSRLLPIETVPDPEFPLSVDPVRDEPVACQEPDVSPSDLSTTQISEVVQLQNCRLREEEGEGLTKPQLSSLNQMLMEYQDTFNQGEKQRRILNIESIQEMHLETEYG
ncbi:hypothetical protein HNY73_006500 [Argiope bruennichi]|uniref:Uncharacterized protein n=1 Tax=Argiope bruennichi TaxID=94029 RepID=A0A8T0FBA6_ARGBR|nr:hypothetical protein HNY73_006500 [Argiope bruennichi]